MRLFSHLISPASVSLQYILIKTNFFFFESIYFRIGQFFLFPLFAFSKQVTSSDMVKALRYFLLFLCSFSVWEKDTSSIKKLRQCKQQDEVECFSKQVTSSDMVKALRYFLHFSLHPVE
jgi:serine kinase of HPr protein (carbohydrate metabolism regulator)